MLIETHLANGPWKKSLNGLFSLLNIRHPKKFKPFSQDGQVRNYHVLIETGRYLQFAPFFLMGFLGNPPVGSVLIAPFHVIRKHHIAKLHPQSLTYSSPLKSYIPNRKGERLPTTIFQGRAVKLPGSSSFRNCTAHFQLWKKTFNSIPGIRVRLPNFTPPKFNSSPPKNDGWKTSFLLGR